MLLRNRALLAAVLSIAAGLPARAERWRLQYFYDEEKSSLHISDLAVASPKRGIAIGVISDGRQDRPTALVTSDGGDHWTLVPTKEVGLSLFLLNEQVGWMVTPRGIWRTNESGRSWTRLPNSPKGALRVWFLDEQHGFAVGMQKGAFETEDGGRKWKPIEAASKIAAEAKHTAYSWISFGKGLGQIVGWSKAPERNREERPAWMDPRAAIHRYESPGVLAVLQSTDNGRNWKASAIKYRGRVTRVRYGTGGYGLWLFEFAESFQYPSEVVRWDQTKNNLTRTYVNKERMVSDIWITPRAAYISGGEVKGELRTLPVPGKLKILRSDKPDFSAWTEMEVDYRAEATRTCLAGAGDDLWVATDTGMILKLTP
jgi:hypothetical protein